MKKESETLTKFQDISSVVVAAFLKYPSNDAVNKIKEEVKEIKKALTEIIDEAQKDWRNEKLKEAECNRLFNRYVGIAAVGVAAVFALTQSVPIIIAASFTALAAGAFGVYKFAQSCYVSKEAKFAVNSTQVDMQGAQL